jgi:hypothetical protein
MFRPPLARNAACPRTIRMEHPAFTISEPPHITQRTPVCASPAPHPHVISQALRVRAPHKPPALTLLNFISQPFMPDAQPRSLDHMHAHLIDQTPPSGSSSPTTHRDSLTLHPEDNHMPSLNADLVSGSPRSLEWRCWRRSCEAGTET